MYFALSALDLIQSGGPFAEGLCARGQVFKQCKTVMTVGGI